MLVQAGADIPVYTAAVRPEASEWQWELEKEHEEVGASDVNDVNGSRLLVRVRCEIEGWQRHDTASDLVQAAFLVAMDGVVEYRHFGA